MSSRPESSWSNSTDTLVPPRVETNDGQDSKSRLASAISRVKAELESGRAKSSEYHFKIAQDKASIEALKQMDSSADVSGLSNAVSALEDQLRPLDDFIKFYDGFFAKESQASGDQTEREGSRDASSSRPAEDA